MSRSVTPGVSRTPPSVTIPAPPRARTRAARMSPMVPAPGLAARLHDQDITRGHRLHHPLLRVLRALHRFAHVGPDRDVAQRPRVAHHRQVRSRGPQTAQERRLDPAPGQLHGQRGRRYLAESGQRVVAQNHGPRRGGRAGRGRIGAGGKRPGVGRGPGHRPVGGELRRALDDRARHRARALQPHFHHVARHHHAGPGRRAGEDHVAGLERHEPRQVGDQLRKGEDEIGAGGVLADLAVDQSGEVQRRRVDIGGGHRGADR